ncbi:MAG: leucine-rich repeat protein [Prevotella sp.]|nr:leucine-rich repeat protein [Candidatus Equicola stercoris]
MKQKIFKCLVFAVLLMCCGEMWANWDNGRPDHGNRCGNRNPDKIVEIDGVRYSLYNNETYTYTDKDGTNFKLSYSCNFAVAAYCSKTYQSTTMTIPRFVRDGNVDYTVVAIGEQFFWYSSSTSVSINKLTIPSTVMALEGFALENNSGQITELIIEDGDNELFCYRTTNGWGAFSWNSNLKNAYVGRNLKYQDQGIENKWYQAPFCQGSYDGLKVKIGPKVTTIPESCFRNKTGTSWGDHIGVLEIDLTDATSLKTIERNAFQDNVLVQDIKFSNCQPNLDIYENAFYGCGLQRVVIISNLNSIANNAFNNCPSLRVVCFLADKSPSSIEFPSNPIIYAKNQAVMNDLKNHYVNKDKIVLYPNDMMLRYTTTDNKVANGMKDCLFNTNERGTGTMYFGQPLETIEEEAFSGCDNLHSVTIPDKVYNIYEDAFGGCSNLRTAIIMGTLSSVKDNAFGDCEGLEEIFYLGTSSPSSVATDAINDSTTIYVENTNGFNPWGTKYVKSWRSGEGDGTSGNPFIIEDYAQLMGFAIEVNLKGKGNICGKLTKDIVANENVLKEDGSLNNNDPFKVWTPIGNSDKPFCGDFNGDGHTISGLYHNYFIENSNGGLFGKLDNNAYVHHLGLVDSYMNCIYGLNGGICGDLTNGHIDNCYNASTVAYGGGIAGWCRDKGRITNCHNVGNINTDGSGIVDLVVKRADAYSSVENCYALEGVSRSAINNINDAKIDKVEVKNAATFASGEVCWLLNGASTAKYLWTQEIGTDESDEYPVFGKDSVYQGHIGNKNFYVNKDGNYNNTLAFDDSKKEDFSCPVPFCANEATYERTSEIGKWATIVLPFQPESGMEELKFYELKEVTLRQGQDEASNVGSLVFTRVDEVEAGVPYLFKNESESDDFTLTGESPASIIVETTEVGPDNFKMKGSYQQKQLDGTTNQNLYYLKDGEFWHATGKINIAPFRAYVEGNGTTQAKSFMLIIEDGEVDAIPGILTDGNIDETEGIYDINGRRLTTPVKGQVNIIRTKSGKKVKRMF